MHVAHDARMKSNTEASIALARLRELIQQAYKEGFVDGHDYNNSGTAEDPSLNYEPWWNDSVAKQLSEEDE